MERHMKYFAILLLIIMLMLSNLFWCREYIELKQHGIKGFNEVTLTLSYLLADISKYFDNITNSTIENYGYVGVIILRILPLSQSLYDLTGRKEYLELRDSIQSLSRIFR